jgi:2-polyprenyl-3-methyl-5-hydroxy-6-metoxy-1,4-benzoquinol methylase
MIYLSLALCHRASSQFFNITDGVWEDEYSKGKWDYISNVAIERARNSLISTFIETYGGADSISSKLHSKRKKDSAFFETKPLKVLDVGCGEGILLDFIRKDRPIQYVGVDISAKAIEIANSKRAKSSSTDDEMYFIQSSAYSFKPEERRFKDMKIENELHIPIKYDVIVFNEVLYYLRHKEIMKLYRSFLEPHGVVIISTFFKSNVNTIKDVIFADAKAEFKRTIDDFTLHGQTHKNQNWKKVPTSFQIGVFRN